MDAAVLPVVVKHQLRERFGVIKKRFAEEDKARKAKESQEVSSLPSSLDQTVLG